MFRSSIFVVFIVFSTTCSSVFTQETCSKTNCILPCCQCASSKSNPTSLNITDVPQLVLLTFIGNLNAQTLHPIRQILDPIHRNPNNCPISSTFFVNDNYTDYCLVQRLFDNQNEIAITASNNRCSLTNCFDENHWRPWIESDWEREIKQQRANIFQKSRIHRSHIRGFRVPHLQIDQNRHLDYIKNFHFHYDSSMLFKSTSLVWPFTMNYPWNRNDCVNCDEKIKTVEALWQFPLHEWTFPNATRPCRTLADVSCLPDDQEHTADVYFDFLNYNFERHASITSGFRSPFVIELDLAWLSDEHHHRLEGLVRFIEHLLDNKSDRYAYFVSIEQALEWLKNPRPLNLLDDFWAFSCSNTIYEYDIDCSALDPASGKLLPLDNERLEALKSDNKSNQTENGPIDRQAEDLFRSDIVLHSIWVFFLLMLTVVFYDKYFSSK